MEKINKQSYEKDLIKYGSIVYEKEKVKAYFKTISDVCNDMINTEIDRNKLASREYLSIENISEKCGITKPTIYAHEILLELIKDKSKIYKKISIREAIRNLINDNNELSKKLINMVGKDVEIQLLSKQNEALKQQIKNQENQIRNLNTIISRLTKGNEA